MESCINTFKRNRNKILNTYYDIFSKSSENLEAEKEFILSLIIYEKNNKQIETSTDGKRRYFSNKKLTKTDLAYCLMNPKNYEDEGCKSYSRFRNTHWHIKRMGRTKWDKYVTEANSRTYELEYTQIIGKLARNGAEKGHLGSQYLLAQILENGIGLPIDYVESQAWRNVAVNVNPPFGSKTCT